MGAPFPVRSDPRSGPITLNHCPLAGLGCMEEGWHRKRSALASPSISFWSKVLRPVVQLSQGRPHPPYPITTRPALPATIDKIGQWPDPWLPEYTELVNLLQVVPSGRSDQALGAAHSSTICWTKYALQGALLSRRSLTGVEGKRLEALGTSASRAFKPYPQTNPVCSTRALARFDHRQGRSRTTAFRHTDYRVERSLIRSEAGARMVCSRRCR